MKKPRQAEAPAAAFDIREAAPGEFDHIWPFFEPVVRAGDTMVYDPGITKEQARDAWFAPNARVYIAWLDGVAVASRYIVPNKAGLGSHVANMGVMIDVRYRGQGLGKKMMEFGLAEAKRLGYKAIQLNIVVSTNSASIHICKEYGFDIVGVLPGAFFYKQQRYVDAYVMYRKL